MRTRLFMRHPGAGFHSIEGLFGAVLPHLPAAWRAELVVVPQPSRGLWPRLQNLWFCRRAAAELNHVTGDIHYVVFGLPRARTILTIHDCGFLRKPGRLRRALLRWLWYVLPARRVAALTTVSAHSARELRAVLGPLPVPIHVVPNCVSPAFQSQPRAFDAACPRILVVGTQARKNLERLVRAVQGLSVRLDIIGALSPAQQALLQACGIAYTQAADLAPEAVRARYEACDMLAFPSLDEGFGMPILEAQQVGRPVLTSDRAPLCEVAGSGACLVDPSCEAALRAGVQRLIDDADYRARLVEAGFRNARRYTPQAVAAQYAAVYATVQPASD
ncbi:MAG: glycosyltransferase family 1 protein [Candidatus Sericytochromatia bacterium]|nr:glycosyltransferase family 1 protein [Candidatus Sericytochromatia bacterium]